MASIDSKSEKCATGKIFSDNYDSGKTDIPLVAITPSDCLEVTKSPTPEGIRSHYLPKHESMELIPDANISFLDLDAPSAAQPLEMPVSAGPTPMENMEQDVWPYSPAAFQHRDAPAWMAHIKGKVQLDYIVQKLREYAMSWEYKERLQTLVGDRRKGERIPPDLATALSDDGNEEEEMNDSSELGNPSHLHVLQPPAFINDNETMGLRGGALERPSQDYDRSAKNPKKGYQAPTQTVLNKGPSAGPAPKFSGRSLAGIIPHQLRALGSSARRSPSAGQPLVQMKQQQSHQHGDLPSGRLSGKRTKAASKIAVADVYQSPSTDPRTGSLTADSKSSSPFQHLPIDDEADDCKQGWLKTPLKQKVVSDTPLRRLGLKTERAESMGKESVEHSGLQTPSPNDWAPWGVPRRRRRRLATDSLDGRTATLMHSGRRQSTINMDIALQDLEQKLNASSLNGNLVSGCQQQIVAHAGGSIKQMAVRDTSNVISSARLPGRSSGYASDASFVRSSAASSAQWKATLDNGVSDEERSRTRSLGSADPVYVIDPLDSPNSLSSETKKSSTNFNSSFTRHTRAQASKTANIPMANTNSAPKVKSRVGSVGPSALYRSATQVDFSQAAQLPSKLNTPLSMKKSSFDQPTHSTSAKQLMPQLSTSQRKYNPRSSLGGFTGQLRAPASLATVAISAVTATSSISNVDMESQVFYHMLWPGQGYTPAQNTRGQLFRHQQPLARNERYLRHQELSAKEAFIQQFGGDYEFRYPDFTAAWDIVEAKYGKPDDNFEDRSLDDRDQPRPLPSFPAPSAKKTHAQHIVSGFKKSISKSGLSNLAKMPSKISLPLKDNMTGRSSSGPPAFEESKPTSRPPSPFEIFDENPRFADDDPRCVTEAKSERYWAARYNTLNEQRMNDPEEFQESIRLAVMLSKKSAHRKDREDYQHQWDEQWDKKEVGRALDVFSELYDLCKSVEARRSLKDYQIYLAREKGWHVLLPDGVPMKEPPTSGMSKVAGKMMGKGDTSIRQMQLEWKEQRAVDKVAASLVKKYAQPFKPRRSILGMHENGIPGYESGMPAKVQPSYPQKSQIPLPKGGSPLPRVYTPVPLGVRIASSSSPGQNGSGSVGRTWYGRKKPAPGDDAPKPLAQVAAKAAMKENVRRE